MPPKVEKTMARKARSNSTQPARCLSFFPQSQREQMMGGDVRGRSEVEVHELSASLSASGGRGWGFWRLVATATCAPERAPAWLTGDSRGCEHATRAMDGFMAAR